MSHATIGLDDSVADPVRAFVADRIDPVFADVRRLLALPRDASGHGAGAATLPALFSILGGLSRVFFPAATGDRQGLLAAAERYPVAEEPAHAIKDPKQLAEGLWAFYQASLVHGLGLHMRRDGRYEPWRIAPLRLAGRDLRLQVERLQALTSGEALLVGLDSPDGWMAGLGPTLSLTTTGLRLEVDALYCGLRRLVRQLAEDGDLAAGAVAVLEPWYAESLRHDADRVAAILAAPAQGVAPVRDTEAGSGVGGREPLSSSNVARCRGG